MRSALWLTGVVITLRPCDRQPSKTEETKMTRKLLAAALMMSVAALSIAGCSDGFDSEEATDECNVKRASLELELCMDDGAYQACLTCYEECGEGCATVATVCPTQFTCPEE